MLRLYVDRVGCMTCAGERQGRAEHGGRWRERKRLPHVRDVRRRRQGAVLGRTCRRAAHQEAQRRWCASNVDETVVALTVYVRHGGPVPTALGKTSLSNDLPGNCFLSFLLIGVPCQTPESMNSGRLSMANSVRIALGTRAVPAVHCTMLSRTACASLRSLAHQTWLSAAQDWQPYHIPAWPTICWLRSFRYQRGIAAHCTSLLTSRAEDQRGWL